MTKGFRFTVEAKRDIAKIRQSTIDRWSKAQSDKYIIRLRDTLLLLTQRPSMGASRNDIAGGALSFPYSSHMIYYFVEKDQLFIFAILHRRMAPERHLVVRKI